MMKWRKGPRGGSAQPGKATVPSGTRIYAIGDVHGRIDLLKRLLSWIERDSAEREDADVHIVFLGDLIDRGPWSREVLEFLIAHKMPFGTRHFVQGNHEEIFLDVLDGGLNWLPDWLAYGGFETLQSYGIDPALAMNPDDTTAFHAALDDHVPTEHRDFLRRMQSGFRIGDYFLTHAGIRPGVSIDLQSEQDLRWGHDDFLDSRADHGATVIHGHYIVEKVIARKNRIGIDTGAYITGKLAALGLERDKSWLLSTKASR